MLTYAIVDRGTVRIDGLENLTGDRAKVGGHYYSDKAPGYSLLAVPAYALAKVALGIPDHPLNRPAVPYRRADYFVAMATSGLLSALAGALLVVLARDLGCGPRRAALVGLGYGLATPAYVYATLAHGHQASATALLAAFALLWRSGGHRAGVRAASAGLLTSYAVVIEPQVAPVAAILGLYFLAGVSGGKWPVKTVGAFALGGTGPVLVLLGYNVLAFGSPWEMGYFHEDLSIFRAVHSAANPTGLRPPDWSKAGPLLWGGHRGLLFYAPIVALAVPGWVALAARRRWGVAAVSASACAAVFLVNLCYPNWTGGTCTGPRLLVPLLPFAMLAVAGFLAVGGRWGTAIGIVLALAGGALILLFQGAGGQVPDAIVAPLRDAVLPLWKDGRFVRTAASQLWPGLGRSPVQFVPLLLFQALAIGAMTRSCRPRAAGPLTGRPGPP